jgi:predicted AlkP superfamily pyrophosphatase or phosphodiesterase
LLFLLAICLAATAAPAADRPRLIVVVSVDQLAQDYLIRFRENFAPEGAFRRVFDHGSHYTQCHHRHAFTITAPGHSVQLTGAYPDTSGIVANEWFDRTTGKTVYCMADPAVEIVGTTSTKPMSPKNLLVETVADVLKLQTGGKSKVFGIAVKDRAAILMTGHNADAAFWLENNVWVTSTYYRPDLPAYLRVLNEGQQIERYRGYVWKLSLPPDRYVNRGPDENTWENPPKGWTTAFPHEVAGPGKLSAYDFAEQVLRSPMGNQLTLDAARAIIEGESLGRDEFPDILCINLSTNDYVGHAFGPHSLEVEDLTYQTDRQLGELLAWLDEHVGQGAWTFALTSDHGVAPIVEVALQHRLPAVRNPLGSLSAVKDKLEAHLRDRLRVATADPPLVQKLDDKQIFLKADHPVFTSKAEPGAGDNFALAQKLAREWLLEQEHVAAVVTRDQIAAGVRGQLHQQLARAFHPRRSGDVLFVFAPYCVPGGKGTTHGSPWHYDTHIPCLLVGAGIAPGTHHRPVSPACLASTIAELLGTDWPSANAEQPLREALK